MGLMKAFVIAASGFNIGMYLTLWCMTKPITKGMTIWYVSWTILMLINIGVTVWSK